MPNLRRKPTRPTHAIAFSVGFASNFVPPSHLTYLNDTLPSFVSAQDLEKALADLQIPDPSFASALLFLSDLNHDKIQVARHHILLVYSVLYRLACIQPTEIESFRKAAEDAVWLCFVAASGTPTAKVITFKQWHSFNASLGSSVGGIDSLPSTDAERRLRSAWRYGRGVPLVLTGEIALDFPRLLVALRVFDAGLVIVLRAIAAIWTNSVQLAVNCQNANTNLQQLTIADFDNHATFLSQFVLMALQQVADAQHLPKSRNHVVPVEGTQTSPERSGEVRNQHLLNGNGDSPRRTKRDSSTSASSSSHEETVQHIPGHHNVTGETDEMDEMDEVSAIQTLNIDMANESMGDSAHEFASAPGQSVIFNGHGMNDLYDSTDSIGFNSSLARVSQRALWVRRNHSGRNSSPFHIDFSSIRLGMKIGEGAYGEVYHGTYLMSPVAVKVFRVNFCADWKTETNDDPGQLNRMSTMSTLQRFASTNSFAKYRNFVREVEMMSLVRHPNLVLYMGACGDPSSPLCIVSELFTGGSLHDYLHKDASFQPTLGTAISMILDIARGMYYLHSSEPSILHRDLKARNVLLSSRGDRNGVPHVVICDFGLCQLFGEPVGQSGQNGNIGTPAYTAPDVINGHGFYAKDDVYSFGILMHEVLTGCVPYEGMRAMQVVFQVTNHDLRPSNKLDENIPPSVKTLMTSCWHKNRELRPMFDEIIARLAKLKDEFT